MSCPGLALLEVRLNTCELSGMEVPNFTDYLIKNLPTWAGVKYVEMYPPFWMEIMVR